MNARSLLNIPDEGKMENAILNRPFLLQMKVESRFPQKIAK